MKKLLLIFAALVLASCSFDNKTGIWKDASDILINQEESVSISGNLPATKYEEIFTKNQTFNEEKEVKNQSNFEIDETVKVVNWLEQYAIPTNNISNFFYSGNKILLSKSSKLSKISTTKNSINRKIIFHKNHLISYDHKGKIFIYSQLLNKKILEFDFYKKNFKKFDKEINFIINDNILYAADNLGYLYALNIDKKSIVWAKNYGISFRSNLKFVQNQLFLANQDNVVYSINPSTGEKNWQLATSLTFLKSNYQNNFAIDPVSKNVFFLNTSGELYSINFETNNINWVLNFNSKSLGGDTELFLSQPLVIKNTDLIITTEEAILSYNMQNGSKNWLFSSKSIFKPIVTKNNVFIILKNNLLVSLDSSNGDVLWSKNIYKNIQQKKIRDKFNSIADFKIVNNEINIYSKNGYLLSFDPANGNLSSANRISKSGIASEIIFLNSNMFFMDNKNRLLKFN